MKINRNVLLISWLLIIWSEQIVKKRVISRLVLTVHSTFRTGMGDNGDVENKNKNLWDG
jgi:hypothetical protein